MGKETHEDRDFISSLDSPNYSNSNLPNGGVHIMPLGNYCFSSSPLN